MDSLTIKQGISLFLSVCYSHNSRTVHLIYFGLGRFVAEDPRKYSVDFGVIWTDSSPALTRFLSRGSRRKQNGDCCGATTTKKRLDERGDVEVRFRGVSTTA